MKTGSSSSARSRIRGTVKNGDGLYTDLAEFQGTALWIQRVDDDWQFSGDSVRFLSKGAGLTRVSPTVTIETAVEHLDLATVIEISQAVSSEMVLEKLVDRLMRTAVEHAGADRGLLFGSQSEELDIEAEANARGEDVVVQVQQRGTRIIAAFPVSLIRHAIRTRETVVLNDVSSQNPFSTDPDIVQRRIRSILCLPLINRGKLLGILYLENHLAPRVFSSAHVTVLKVLASQAAISIANSRLYRDLEESEYKLRQIVDAVPGLIWSTDPEGVVTHVSQRLLDYSGTRFEDHNDQGWQRLVHPDDLPAIAKAYYRAIQTGTSYHGVLRFRRADGEFRWHHARFEALRDRQGRIIQWYGLSIDVEEAKQAEDRLRRSEAWLSQAQRLSHTGFWVYDATKMLYVYWSDESYRIWGFDPLRGLPSRDDMWQRIHPDDREKVQDTFQHAMRHRSDFTAEFRIRLPDGTVKYLEGTSQLIYSQLGALVEAFTTTVDVTQRRRAQDEHEKLRQLESDIAHINRVSMMGELAASLSHEILHPIATARNNARAGMRFLEMRPPNLDEAREALGCIVRDADRAKEIVGRIRSQIKKAPPRKECFALNDAINEVIVMVRSAIAKNGVSVGTRLMHGPVPVHGDRVQLQQVLVNLILNAVEAMSSVEGGPRELSIGTESCQTGDILVAVRDSGPGIDPASLERVFEPFYTTKTSGVGMGLSICQTIINGHGGRLWAGANEPRGAVFQFTLPVAEEDS
jgi:PAS domain S-box-containing protein